MQYGYSQKKKINFTSLTSKDGLSSHIVKAILKDRYGLMWFATEDGLNKYDGTSFTVYRHNIADTNSLQSNDILALHEDRSGNLWIGTNGGAISLYDRKKDCFRNLTKLPGFHNQNNVVASISSDYLGRIWIATFGGLSILDTKSWKVTRLSLISSQRDKQWTGIIHCIFEDSKRRMWVGSEGGLFLYNRNKNSFLHFQHSIKDPSSLVSNAVTSIEEDKEGSIWVGTTEGLSMLNPDGRSFRNFRHVNGKPGTLSSNEIYSVAADNEGQLWLGTEEGLNILNIKSGEIRVYKPNRRDVHSLTNKSISYVYIDKQGICWLSVFRGGINKYDKNLSLFNLKQSNGFDEKGLSASLVTSFAEDGNGNVFVGTDGGGVNLFNRKTDLFQHINLEPKDKTGSSKLSVLALETSREKRLWIGTYSYGLFVYDLRSGKYQQFTKGSTVQDLNNNHVFCLKEDSKGNIWIGTNGGGLNVYNPVTHSFTTYCKNPRSKNAYSLPLNGYIRAIEEDDQGNIWIGSHGSGLAVLNPLSKASKLYDRSNSKLPSNVVLSILRDQDNNIWVGTLGGGLSLFNKKSNEFVSFSEKDGLANGIVYKILQDRRGQLWMSTNKGISSFDPKVKKFKNYNHYNGIQNSNFVYGSGMRLADGELFFGGLDGFNHFYPKDIRTNRNIPGVLLTDLKVDNKSIVPSEDSPLEEHVSIAKQISVNYKQNFSISFVALSYTTPQQYRYSYKLAGFDKGWNNVGALKMASYTNLDPGEYIFKVRASNIDGTRFGNTTLIKIHVKPPFWLTIYAYIFYALAITGLLLYARYRGIQKLRRNFMLEQERIQARQLIVQERKEAERLHELDMLKIKFLTNLSHEFRTPISLIMGPVDKLLSEKKDESASGQLNMIKRNARRLLNLVNQLLDFRKMEEHELKLNLYEGEFVSFINEVSDSFKDLSERKNIHLEFISEIDRLYTSFDHDKIERILFNLLSNAFKFTPGGGSIRLELKEADESIEPFKPGIIIKITDTGIGIPADKKEKIFERFFQNETAASFLNQGSGIGLSITREFVKMHGGSIYVESEPEQGSSFIIYLPFSPLNSTGPDSGNFSDIEDSEPLSESVEDSAIHVNGSETPSVLLVEDNEDFRFYLKDNLKAFYKVFEASNGKEGWQKALACHPQVIVSDINMPLMDGIELCSKVKSDKRTNHIPIILLTALTGEEEQIRGLKTGANDYMTKPFNFEILNAKIKNLLVLNRTLKNTYTKQIKVQTPEVVIESHSDKLLNKVVLYIEENLNNPMLSVEELSKHVGMSRGSLYHKILELTGQSPVEYIRSVKLDKAAVLLEKSDMNVAQIAYMVGFATPNYFAKSFKAKFNMQPSEFMSLKRKVVERARGN